MPISDTRKSADCSSKVFCCASSSRVICAVYNKKLYRILYMLTSKKIKKKNTHNSRSFGTFNNNIWIREENISFFINGFLSSITTLHILILELYRTKSHKIIILSFIFLMNAHIIIVEYNSIWTQYKKYDLISYQRKDIFLII